MGRVSNPTADDVSVPSLELFVPAGGTVDVSDSTEAALDGHPVLEIAGAAAPPPSVAAAPAAPTSSEE